MLSATVIAMLPTSVNLAISFFISPILPSIFSRGDMMEPSAVFLVPSAALSEPSPISLIALRAASFFSSSATIAFSASVKEPVAFFLS